MKVTVDGQVYEYDANRLMVREAMELQQRTGLNLSRWQAALQEGDPTAILGLVYLIKQRAGEKPEWDAIDFDLAAVEIEDDDEADEPGPKGDADAA